VHAILYFLAGPRISQTDLIAMKKLKKYCNIIPILAKGDALTIQEIKEMKLNLIKEAHDYKIEWFDFNEVG
jgi:septin family protein